MNEAPQWWYVVSGLFFGLGMIFYVALIVLLLSLVSLVKKLSAQVQDLMKKIDGITVKVDSLVVSVRTVTDKVGVQATGAATNIHALTRGISEKADYVSIAFMVFGAVRSFLDGRKAVKR